MGFSSRSSLCAWYLWDAGCFQFQGNFGSVGCGFPKSLAELRGELLGREVGGALCKRVFFLEWRKGPEHRGSLARIEWLEGAGEVFFIYGICGRLCGSLLSTLAA